MLDPDNRVTLSDQLTPPPGYRLGHAVATTFTLDLTAMLQVPLGFAGQDLSSTADPLTLMQAIRSATGRVDVFCQAGEIAVPSKPNPLIEYLGSAVHPVAVSAGRLFHPKLWLVRYDALDDTEPARFRLLCGSRNLTHDRSWDAVVTLDGTSTGRGRAVNRPLADFVGELSGRAASPLDTERAEAIAELAESVRTVEWERPSGTHDAEDWLSFHVFGTGRRPVTDLNGYRHLVISPFLSDEGLDEVLADVRGQPGSVTIVSRPEEFDALNDESRQWLLDEEVGLLCLDPAASIEDELDDDALGSESADSTGANTVLRWSLRGLHAKVYVVERSRRAHVFIGSANATGAAWLRNDEALVEVIGRTNVLGIDALVGDQAAFRKLLTVHELGPQPAEDPREQLELLLHEQLHELSSRRLTAQVVKPDQPDGRWSERVDSTDPVTLRASVQEVGASLHVALVTAPQLPQAAASDRRLSATFQLEGMEQITPFVILALTAPFEGRSVSASTVVLADLLGDPEERMDLLLARYITSPEMFRRLLMMLLGLADESGLGDEGVGMAFGSWRTGAAGEGLLERFALALATNPSTIDDVARVVDRLSTTDEGRKLFPHGWDEVWPQVQAARQRVRGAR